MAQQRLSTGNLRIKISFGDTIDDFWIKAMGKKNAHVKNV
jgi:hypothetical protein